LKAFVALTDRDWQEVLPGCPPQVQLRRVRGAPRGARRRPATAPDGLEDEGEPVEGEMTGGTLYLHSRPSCPRPRRPTWPARDEGVQAKLAALDCRWDLMVVDDAHRMSATFATVCTRWMRGARVAPARTAAGGGNGWAAWRRRLRARDHRPASAGKRPARRRTVLAPRCGDQNT